MHLYYITRDSKVLTLSSILSLSLLASFFPLLPSYRAINLFIHYMDMNLFGGFEVWAHKSISEKKYDIFPTKYFWLKKYLYLKKCKFYNEFNAERERERERRERERESITINFFLTEIPMKSIDNNHKN